MNMGKIKQYFIFVFRSMMTGKSKNKHEKEWLAKLMKYCSYQERCRSDVIKKMKNMAVPASYHSRFIKILEKENFLNEERFASAFVRGKFRENKWGKLKIIWELRKKNIPQNLIDKSLKELSSREYKGQVRRLAERKINELKNAGKNPAPEKIYAFLESKGYEAEVIMEIINEMLE